MKKLLILIQLLIASQTFAQVTFQFIPEINGRTIDGLLNCKIINGSGKKTGSLTLTISERKSGTVMTVRTTSFNLMPGVNSLPLSATRSAAFDFYVNPIAVIIRHDHNFPVGDYEYCFTINYAGGEMPSEQCFDYNLVPFAELHLIEPYDRDTLCDKRPLLTWQPLIPTLQGTTYQLVLAEIKQDQNAVEALNYNLPIINQSHILSPVLNYPPIAPLLEDGKTYAWQVTAYKEQTILNRSEIWTFKEQCNEKKKDPVLTDDGYRDIEDLIRGNYYVASGMIRFAVTNPYKETKFKYQIETLNNPGKKIKGLPKITLAAGKNKIMIDLANTDSFIDGYSYLMTLWLPDGSMKNLRFIYKD